MSEPGSLLRSLSGRTTARNFHSHVINAIGSGVISGRYPIGSTLPNDAALMANFDVSRTVLREALKTLEAKGLLEARPKVGTKIAKKSRWNLYDPQVLAWHLDAPPDQEFLKGLSETRLALEPLGARHAAEKRSADQIRLMQYWIKQMEMSFGAPDTFCLADFELHRIIADASHNPFLRALYGVTELSHAYAYVDLIENAHEDTVLYLLSLHRKLVYAVEKADPALAENAMKEAISYDLELGSARRNRSPE